MLDFLSSSGPLYFFCPFLVHPYSLSFGFLSSLWSFCVLFLFMLAFLFFPLVLLSFSIHAGFSLFPLILLCSFSIHAGFSLSVPSRPSVSFSIHAGFFSLIPLVSLFFFFMLDFLSFLFCPFLFMLPFPLLWSFCPFFMDFLSLSCFSCWFSLPSGPSVSFSIHAGFSLFFSLSWSFCVLFMLVFSSLWSLCPFLFFLSSL
ncbi:unnamed protein product [Acanthosepion pharaonis]|uniref:Uncharacterized protein n=1 Tax=Acanthosepion pharaonis TaxID=158019 RepID=A0A812DEZ1_ACAPH|nr:unnamed protein product [Sepia pharaonis]